MKKISFDDEFNLFKSIFDKNCSEKHEICLWQKTEDEKARIIQNVILDKNIFTDKSLWFKTKSNTKCNLNTGVCFYYSNDQEIIFKTSIKEINDSLCHLNYPDEMMLLEGEEVYQIQGDLALIEENTLVGGQKISNQFDWMKVKGKKLSDEANILRARGYKEEQINDILRIKGSAKKSDHDAPPQINDIFKPEDDAKFKALRESQRVQPKVQKIVSVMRVDLGLEHPLDYKLFDLSQGGAGLIVTDPNEFKRGERLTLLAVDGIPLPKELLGEVVAIRIIEEGKPEFKIGIKFGS